MRHFLAKFSPSGGYIWGRRVGTDLSTDAMGPFARLQAMAVDGNGDLVLGGDFLQHANLGGESMDPGNAIINGTSTYYDHFLVKYSGATGSYQWSRALTGSSGAYGYLTSVAADAQNNVIVTGSLNYGTYNYGGAQSLVVAYPNQDGFVAKYSSQGVEVWAQQFNSPSAEGYCVAVDSTGYPVVTGGFSGTANLNGLSATSAGGWDILLGRLNP